MLFSNAENNLWQIPQTIYTLYGDILSFCFFWACHLIVAGFLLEEMTKSCHLSSKLEIRGLFTSFLHRCHFIPFVISVAMFCVLLPVFLRWGNQNCRQHSRSEHTVDLHSSVRLFFVLFSICFSLFLSRISFSLIINRGKSTPLIHLSLDFSPEAFLATVTRKKTYPGIPALQLCSGQCNDSPRVLYPFIY